MGSPASRPASRPAETTWIEIAPDAPALELADAVREGLARPPRSLPSQFFYDAEGSRLFEQICDLPEYYLTRAEAEILEVHAGALAARLPGIRTLVELGSGSAVKTEHLLHAFGRQPGSLCYAPIDVSRSALEESVERLEAAHPEIEILPAVAEYEAGLAELARLDLGPKLILWLGSSIGNLSKPDAATFLSHVRAMMSDDDRMLVGVDLRKDRAVLEAAYDDAAGVTARFDLNLLARINRELGSTFDLDAFRHVVEYDEASGSVRSFLESQRDQAVEIRDLDLALRFTAGERIHTEDSYKYGIGEIDALADAAGLDVEQRLFDRARRFTLNLFAAR